MNCIDLKNKKLIKSSFNPSCINSYIWVKNQSGSFLLDLLVLFLKYFCNI